MKSKVLALAFFLFVLLVMLAADGGRLPPFLRALYSFPNGDRVGHVVLYGILALLLAGAFPRSFALGRFRLPFSIAALLAFGVAEECSQSLFTTRTADFVDLLCSCTGIFLGTWGAQRWPRARKTT